MVEGGCLKVLANCSRLPVFGVFGGFLLFFMVTEMGIRMSDSQKVPTSEYGWLIRQNHKYNCLLSYPATYNRYDISHTHNGLWCYFVRKDVQHIIYHIHIPASAFTLWRCIAHISYASNRSFRGCITDLTNHTQTCLNLILLYKIYDWLEVTVYQCLLEYIYLSITQ